MDEVHARLTQIALAAREIILEANRSHDRWFKEFPAGACEPTTQLLARYLKTALGLDALYILGERAGHTHAWLEVDGIIVDITADQFDDCRGPVIVARRSPWHETWGADEPRLPMCSPDQWGPYPHAIWHVLVQGFAERGFPRPERRPL